MVTKPYYAYNMTGCGSVLAKILMVTKLIAINISIIECSVLAKILMVTKQAVMPVFTEFSSVLAKILMVTKPQKYGSTFLNVIEY